MYAAVIISGERESGYAGSRSGGKSFCGCGPRTTAGCASGAGGAGTGAETGASPTGAEPGASPAGAETGAAATGEEPAFAKASAGKTGAAAACAGASG